MNIDDEVVDEENLVLPEEIYEETSGDLPIRHLDHFSIFDDETNLLISLDEAEDPKFGQRPYFLGHVSAKLVSENDEDFDEYMAGDGEDNMSHGQKEADRTLRNFMEVRVQSSAIVEIWESMEPERDGLVSEQRSVSSICLSHFLILVRSTCAAKSGFKPDLHGIFSIVPRRNTKISSYRDGFVTSLFF
jgi:hypothetical protein